MFNNLVIFNQKTFFILLVIFIFFLIYRFFFFKEPYYKFTWVADFLKNKKKINFLISGNFYKYLIILTRFSALSCLLLAIARIQIPDEKTRQPIKGIDIMLNIDTSGSMVAIDDLDVKLPRIEVAKQEAVKFVNRRVNDSIGLVLFAKGTLLRCPLTYDKNAVMEIIKGIDLNLLDPNGTQLAAGLITAINRLKNSSTRTKIIILLTDGQPNFDIFTIEDAINLAKEFNIKIYTIAIGSDNSVVFDPSIGGYQYVPFNVNTELLNQIAFETNGKFFEAKSPNDLEKIYNFIDALEKSDIEKPIYGSYFELFPFFLVLTILLFCLEKILKIFVCPGIC